MSDVEDGEISSDEEAVVVEPSVDTLEKDQVAPAAVKTDASPVQTSSKLNDGVNDGGHSPGTSGNGTEKREGRHILAAAAGRGEKKCRELHERPASPERGRHHRRHHSPTPRKSPDRGRGRKRTFEDSPEDSSNKDRLERSCPANRKVKTHSPDEDEWGYKLNVRPEKDATHSREDTSKIPCKFYNRGGCNRILDCPFSHDGVATKINEICRYYISSAGCKKRKFCLYMHEDFPCKYFHTGAECYAGDNCRFSHKPLTEETKGLLDKERGRTRHTFRREPTPETDGRRFKQARDFYSATAAQYTPPKTETVSPGKGAERGSEEKRQKDVDYRLRPAPPPSYAPWWQQLSSKTLMAVQAGGGDVDMRLMDTDLRNPRGLKKAESPEQKMLAEGDFVIEEDEDALKIDEGLEEDEDEEEEEEEAADHMAEDFSASGRPKRKRDEEEDAAEDTRVKKRKVSRGFRKEYVIEPLFSLPSNLAGVSVFDQILASFRTPAADDVPEQSRHPEPEETKDDDSGEMPMILESPMSPEDENGSSELEEPNQGDEEVKNVDEGQVKVTKAEEHPPAVPKDPRLARLLRKETTQQPPTHHQEPQCHNPHPLPQEQQNGSHQPPANLQHRANAPVPPQNGHSGQPAMNGFQQAPSRPLMGLPVLPPGYRPMAPAGGWANGPMAGGWMNGHGPRPLSQPRGGLLPTPRIPLAPGPRFSNFSPVPARGLPRPRGGSFRPRGNELDEGREVFRDKSPLRDVDYRKRDRDYRQRDDGPRELFGCCDRDYRHRRQSRPHYRV